MDGSERRDWLMDAGKENTMFTVIRNYTGVPSIAEDLKKHIREIETDITTVPGFIAHYLVKTTDGATSVTICDQKTGCDESTKRLELWLKKNLPNLKFGTPEVIAGEVSYNFRAPKTAKV
jgi:hypothetical protein